MITRHGETEWNKEGKMQGWRNSNLTQKGVENAEKLGNSLKNIEFEYIYCSPLGRAVETAKYIRGNKDTRIILIEYLKELSFGSWEGIENSEIEELYPEQYFNFWNKPHLYEHTDGESFENLIVRVRKALNEIINNSNGNNILIVSHALVIKAIYAIIKSYSLEEFWNPPFMHDTCLTVLETTDEGIKVILEADVSHLS